MKVLTDNLAETAADLDNLAQSTSVIQSQRTKFNNLQLHEICTWLAFRVREAGPRASWIGESNMASTPEARNTENRAWTWSGRVIALFLVLLTSFNLHAQSKVSPDLANTSSTTSVNVIIQYFNAPTSTDDKAVTSLGGSNGKALGRFKGKQWKMTAGNAAKLASTQSNVKYVSVDRPLKMASDDVMVQAVFADLALAAG